MIFLAFDEIIQKNLRDYDPEDFLCVLSIVYFLFDYCLKKPESIRSPLKSGILQDISLNSFINNILFPYLFP